MGSPFLGWKSAQQLLLWREKPSWRRGARRGLPWYLQPRVTVPVGGSRTGGHYQHGIHQITPQLIKTISPSCDGSELIISGKSNSEDTKHVSSRKYFFNEILYLIDLYFTSQCQFDAYSNSRTHRPLFYVLLFRNNKSFFLNSLEEEMISSIQNKTRWIFKPEQGKLFPLIWSEILRVFVER